MLASSQVREETDVVPQVVSAFPLNLTMATSSSSSRFGLTSSPFGGAGSSPPAAASSSASPDQPRGSGRVGEFDALPTSQRDQLPAMLALPLEAVVIESTISKLPPVRSQHGSAIAVQYWLC